MTEPKYIFQGASFGGNNDIYRYSLVREWDLKKPTIIFIMLNPSTADAKVLDPTVRRCLGYSQEWGFGKMIILNLFALRSTNPQKLMEIPDPIGWRNNLTLIRECEKRDRLIIAAWGTHGTLNNRDQEVIYLITHTLRKDLHCIQLTKEGIPGHPLYLKKNVKPIIFQAAE